MPDVKRPALGLSVGATNLAAVTADNAVRRRAVLTLFTGRPPMVGHPLENTANLPNPESGEQGLVIADFVDRVGDPIAILAADGSSHRSEMVLAESLRALAYVATAGRPLPEVTAVSYPAHWRSGAVGALRRALAQVPEWSREPVTLHSDVTAALTALQHDPGVPIRGVIALCDFGGSGTSITLVDAASGYQPIGPTVRHLDFSGDLVDQALLTHVIGDLAGAGSVDLASTSAIGSLTLLRGGCRSAKERLSAGTVTALPVELPGYRGDVRLTRTELDEAVGGPLADIVEVLHDTLRRNGVRASDLVAVVTVGGGARIAAVTTTLSEHLRLPVITTPRPGLSAAIGSALRALRGPADDIQTAMAPAAATGLAPAAVELIVEYPDPDPADSGLAWSQADELPELAHFGDDSPPDHAPGGLTAARPQLAFEEDHDVFAGDAAGERAVPFYRRPLAVMVASVVVLLSAVSAIGVVLTNDSNATPSSTPTPSISATRELPQPLVEAQQPAPPLVAEAPIAGEPPTPRTVTAVPAPVTRTQVVEQPAPVTETQPPPAPETVTETQPPPAPETVTETQTVAPSTEGPLPSTEVQSAAPAPAPTTSAPPRWLPKIPPIPTIPGLPPFVRQPPTP